MTAWTLVTDDLNGRSRSALAAVRALAGAGYRVGVTTSGPRSLAASSRHCARAFRVPAPGAAGYRDAVQQTASRLRSVAVFPSSDEALSALDQGSAHLVDKRALGAFDQLGLRTVPGQVFPDGTALVAAAADLAYPIVVKPTVKDGKAWSSARRVNGPAGLAALSPVPDPLLVQPFLSGEMRAVAGVLWGGELRAAVHQAYVRIWPAECGVASCAVTVAPDTETERQLERLLAGHSGVFQVQLIGDHLLDVNPRVYGSLSLAVAAGANLPALVCEAAAGRERELVRARPGVHYRWLEGDVRNLTRQVRGGTLTPLQAVRQLRPRRGTAHSVESLTDPGPMLARAVQVAAALR